jgi:endonuclease/exonuclease/phosphatase family metal-dependent hydrolase
MATMRRVLWIVAGLLSLPLWSPSASRAQKADIRTDLAAAVGAVRVMTANVRYGTADDGENHWDLRKDLLVEAMRQERPDLIGTQEILPFQATYLQQQLGQYDYVGRSRELDQPDGEQCGIFFRSARFVELERGHFWLSETPQFPGSQSWDAALPRMATWLKLFDRTTQRVSVIINTHFDHQGREARRQSAGVLLRYARQFAAQYPLIITGDFNCPEESAPYVTLTSPADAASSQLIDIYRLVHPHRQANEGTFNGFQGRRDGGRIDWILATPAWKPVSAQIITFQRDGRFPSDHFPVVAELSPVAP